MMINTNLNKNLPWHQSVMLINSTIEQAVQVLNRVGLKIVLVTDKNGVLQGTISDGDVRRGLMNGLTLSSPIEKIINYQPLVVPPGIKRKTVIQLMTVNKIQQIPIVNKEMKVLGLHTWDEVSVTNIRTDTMVIMAGGKGTRLYPQTENCPKPMIKVSGKPMLEHIINRAKAEGFVNFVLAINYLGNVIEDYFGNGERFGIKIEYLREKTPLGTAGALTLLEPLPSSAFIVTNGDVFTDIRYGEVLDFHNINKGKATMAIKLQEWQNPFGVVKTDGLQIIGYEEKPISQNYINAGVYVLEPSVIKLLRKSSKYDMPEVFTILQEMNELVIAYPSHEQWTDLGRLEDLVRLEKKSQDSSQENNETN
jgi:dTDP-glucose pyrophosphorylase